MVYIFSRRIVILLSQSVQSDADKFFGSFQRCLADFQDHCYLTDCLNPGFKISKRKRENWGV